MSEIFPMKNSRQKNAVCLEADGTRTPMESPEEIVQSAYRKFGRGRLCRKAVEMCFEKEPEIHPVTQGGEAA
jgi:hypothetical protein